LNAGGVKILKIDHFEEEQAKERKVIEKPGELFFIIILILIVAALLTESIKLKGIVQGTANGPGVMPQIISFMLLLLLVLICFQLIKKKELKVMEVLQYLFSAEVIILLGLVVLFALLLERLHFELTALLFLWASMFLLERRDALKKLVISLFILGTIVLIFAYGFKVILP
jgi:hypothetical protein